MASAWTKYTNEFGSDTEELVGSCPAYIETNHIIHMDHNSY